MWINGKQEGKGKFLYENEHIYEGDWLNDLRHGKGIFICNKNCAKYEGEFLNDERNGIGFETSSDGTVKKGEWVNGEFKRWI